MTASQQNLLALLSKSIFQGESGLRAPDWKEIYEESKAQAVSLLAFQAVDPGALPADLAEEWRTFALLTLSSNARVLHHHSRLHGWMAEAGIPYVILKGFASAFYYPEPACRTMGDVDFLVAEKDLERAGKILEENGLTRWKEPHASHIVFKKRGMHLEMHFNVAGVPEGVCGERVQEYLDGIFEKASPESIGADQAILPCAFHHGLILLLHTCHHLTGEGIGLRHLCDWAVFENRFSDTEFRRIFEEKLKAVGLWRFAQILTAASIRFLGAEEKEWAEPGMPLAEALMEDVLAGGNFGRKAPERTDQMFLISSRGKNGVGKISVIRQFFRSGNGIIRSKWPKAGKNKFLLPVGWGVFGTRYFVRVLCGKRRNPVAQKTLQGALRRRELYQQFQLYEVDEK